MPVAYSSSIIARSRRPSGVETSGCAIERVHLFERQKLRQRRPGARRPQIVGRDSARAGGRARGNGRSRGSPPPSRATDRGDSPRVICCRTNASSACRSSARAGGPRRRRTPPARADPARSSRACDRPGGARRAGGPGTASITGVDYDSIRGPVPEVGPACLSVRNGSRFPPKRSIPRRSPSTSSPPPTSSRAC